MFGIKKTVLIFIILSLCVSLFGETKKLPESMLKLDIGKSRIEDLLKYNVPVIVDFGADWCGPCKAFHPTLEKIQEKYKGRIIIKYVDIDKHNDLLKGLPVQAVPTQMFWTKDGKPFVSKNRKDFLKFRDRKNKTLKYSYHVGGFKEKDLESIIKEMGVK